MLAPYTLSSDIFLFSLYLPSLDKTIHSCDLISHPNMTDLCSVSPGWTFLLRPCPFLLTAYLLPFSMWMLHGLKLIIKERTWCLSPSICFSSILHLSYWRPQAPKAGYFLFLTLHMQTGLQPYILDTCEVSSVHLCCSCHSSGSWCDSTSGLTISACLVPWTWVLWRYLKFPGQ